MSQVFQALCFVVGCAVPAYRSFKALETFNNSSGGADSSQLLVHWMVYWCVYAVYQAVESWIDVLVGIWLPFYSFLKLAFLLWLSTPQGGAKFLFEKYMRPFLLQNETFIDHQISRAQNNGFELAISISKSLFEAFSKLISTAAIQGREKMIETFGNQTTNNSPLQLTMMGQGGAASAPNPQRNYFVQSQQQQSYQFSEFPNESIHHAADQSDYNVHMRPRAKSEWNAHLYAHPSSNTSAEGIPRGGSVQMERRHFQNHQQPTSFASNMTSTDQDGYFLNDDRDLLTPDEILMANHPNVSSRMARMMMPQDSNSVSGSGGGGGGYFVSPPEMRSASPAMSASRRVRTSSNESSTPSSPAPYTYSQPIGSPMLSSSSGMHSSNVRSSSSSPGSNGTAYGHIAASAAFVPFPPQRASFAAPNNSFSPRTRMNAHLDASTSGNGGHMGHPGPISYDDNMLIDEYNDFDTDDDTPLNMRLRRPRAETTIPKSNASGDAPNSGIRRKIKRKTSLERSRRTAVDSGDG